MSGASVLPFYANMVRTKVIAVRVSPAEFDALTAAAVVYRKRTGELITVSDLLRWGANAFSSQVGIVMPGAVEN